MTSWSRVETNSHADGRDINSITEAETGGDSPHAEYIAGMTAGEIGKGHARAHGSYLSSMASIEAYTQRSGPRGDGGGDPFGALNNVLNLFKNLG